MTPNEKQEELSRWDAYIKSILPRESKHRKVRVAKWQAKQRGRKQRRIRQRDARKRNRR